MNILSLSLRIIAIVAAIAAAVLYFLANGKVVDAETRLAETQRVNSLNLKKLEENLTILDGLKAEKAEAEETLQELETQLKSATSDKELSRAEIKKIRNKLKIASEQISSYEIEGESLREKLIEAEAALVEAADNPEIARLQERVNQLQSSNDDLRAKVAAGLQSALSSQTGIDVTQADLREVTSSSVVDASVAGSSSASLINGTNVTGSATSTTETASTAKATLSRATIIESVNAASGLAIIANNQDLQLRKGAEFRIISDFEQVARFRIDEVGPEIALAYILPGSNASKLRAGSVVSMLP